MKQVGKATDGWRRLILESKSEFMNAQQSRSHIIFVKRPQFLDLLE